jgi:primosomal protein N' (replication factor Y)
MKVPVLLPKVFNYPFTYEFESKMPLKMGDIVEVPFGKKKEIGVVWDSIKPIDKKIKIKKIEKKI